MHINDWDSLINAIETALTHSGPVRGIKYHALLLPEGITDGATKDILKELVLLIAKYDGTIVQNGSNAIGDTQNTFQIKLCFSSMRAIFR